MYRVRTCRQPADRAGRRLGAVHGRRSSIPSRDRNESDLYLARWDGSRTIRLTYSPEGEGSPRFSPDGKYISFTSSRGAPTSGPNAGAQVWLLDAKWR